MIFLSFENVITLNSWVHKVVHRGRGGKFERLLRNIFGGGGGCQFYVIFIRIFVCFMGLRSNVLFVINITVFVCFFFFLLSWTILAILADFS